MFRKLFGGELKQSCAQNMLKRSRNMFLELVGDDGEVRFCLSATVVDTEESTLSQIVSYSLLTIPVDY